MSIELLQSEVRALPPELRRKLVAFIVALENRPVETPSTTPLKALESLQEKLHLDDNGAAKWMAAVSAARR